jgi:hypothetical protein
LVVLSLSSRRRTARFTAARGWSTLLAAQVTPVARFAAAGFPALQRLAFSGWWTTTADSRGRRAGEAEGGEGEEKDDEQKADRDDGRHEDDDSATGDGVVSDDDGDGASRRPRRRKESELELELERADDAARREMCRVVDGPSGAPVPFEEAYLDAGAIAGLWPDLVSLEELAQLAGA